MRLSARLVAGGWIFGLGFSTTFAISKMQSFA
jgi:hypothetical protein